MQNWYLMRPSSAIKKKWNWKVLSCGQVIPGNSISCLIVFWNWQCLDAFFLPSWRLISQPALLSWWFSWKVGQRFRYMLSFILEDSRFKIPKTQRKEDRGQPKTTWPGVSPVSGMWKNRTLFFAKKTCKMADEPRHATTKNKQVCD